MSMLKQKSGQKSQLICSNCGTKLEKREKIKAKEEISCGDLGYTIKEALYCPNCGWEKDSF